MIRMPGLPAYIAAVAAELVTCGVDLVTFDVCSEQSSGHPKRKVFALQLERGWSDEPYTRVQPKGHMNRKNPTCKCAYFRSTWAYLGPPLDIYVPKCAYDQGGVRVSVFYGGRALGCGARARRRPGRLAGGRWPPAAPRAALSAVAGPGRRALGLQLAVGALWRHRHPALQAMGALAARRRVGHVRGAGQAPWAPAALLGAGWQILGAGCMAAGYRPT